MLLIRRGLTALPGSLYEEIPSGRPGTPDEVAGFVYQIATSSKYLTGQVIKFDGGWI